MEKQTSLLTRLHRGTMEVATIAMDIFCYSDYRLLLNDFYEQRKALNPSGFSYRSFARTAGLGSKSYLRMVIEGKRNIGAETIKKFSKALRFNQKEAVYFEALVHYNQAKSDSERDLYLKKIVSLKVAYRFHNLDKETLKFFSNPYHIILREMVALPHFKEDYYWISECLGKKISPMDVRAVIKTLLKLKLLKRDSEKRLVLATGILKAPPNPESLEVFNYYSLILGIAKEMMFCTPRTDREFLSLTIPLAKEMLPKIREMLQANAEDIAHYVNQTKNRNFDDVFQVNIQMFPVSQTKKDGAK